MVNVIRRQKALGFNTVRLPFTMPALFVLPIKDWSTPCPQLDPINPDVLISNPGACDIVSSALKPGHPIPHGTEAAADTSIAGFLRTFRVRDQDIRSL